jgi:hypothetical protein
MIQCNISATQTQQATHGIFIGFPSNQAGWLFYTEQTIGSSHIHISHDVTFDEHLDSALIIDTHPFQGSLALHRSPAQNQLQPFDDQIPMETTGSIEDFNTDTLPPDQSEEGNKEKSTTEPINETNEPNIVEEETQDTQTNRYPSRT